MCVCFFSFGGFSPEVDCLLGRSGTQIKVMKISLREAIQIFLSLFYAVNYCVFYSAVLLVIFGICMLSNEENSKFM